MNRFLLAITAMVALSTIGDQADAKHRLFNRKCCPCSCPCECSKDCTCGYQGSETSPSHGRSLKGSKGFWPFTDGEDPVDPNVNPAPEPTPGPEPIPVPTPEPTPDTPLPPDVVPVPDPTPLPPEPPAPTPQSVLPKDPAELNSFVAAKLGGYSKANTTRNGCPIDIWQSRGKQRIAWAVERGDDWRNAVIEALIAKAAGGSGVGGIVLICHCPNDPTPVDPVPTPTPAPEPLPIPEPTPVQNRLIKFGGEELVTAEAVCRAAGLWLVVVHDKTGDLHRVIYGNVTPKTVKWKAAKKK